MSLRFYKVEYDLPFNALNMDLKIDFKVSFVMHEWTLSTV